MNRTEAFEADEMMRRSEFDGSYWDCPDDELVESDEEYDAREMASVRKAERSWDDTGLVAGAAAVSSARPSAPLSGGWE